MHSIHAARQAPLPSTAQKGNRFAAIRKLPTAEQSATTAAAAASAGSGAAQRTASTGVDSGAAVDTVQSLRDAQRRDADEDATDGRIRRHRYAQLVARLNAQRSLYQSTGVFVEAMLREVRQCAEVGVAAEAAAATWGLRLLSKTAGHGALDSVLESLLPAVYCEYAPEKLCRAPPAVQLQVREPDVLLDNPYFTHAMFVDEVHVDKRCVLQLQKSLEASMRANDARRNMARRLIDCQRRQCLCVAFNGWRHQVRHQRLLRVMGDNTAKRRVEETSRLRMQAVFYQWKLTVERSRTAYLTERLHDAAFQLENAKNQFQLQCYRADRLVHTAKEATEEMARVSLINDGLQRQVEELTAEQVRREKEYNEKLTRNVTQLLKLLGTYDALAHVLLRAKQVAESFVPEKPPASLASSRAASVDHGDAGVVETAAGHATASADWESASDSALHLLRQWCDAVLATVTGRGASFRPIRTFGADFASGERYLYILQYVFPEVVQTVLSVHDMDVEARLRRIRGYTVECGLRYTLVPSDLLNEREDLLVCSLSELYQRHLQRVWDKTVSRSAAELDTFRDGDMEAALTGCAAPSPTAEPAEDAPAAAHLDESAVLGHIADYVERVKGISEGFSTSLVVENELAKASSAIAAHEAHLGGERLQGRPIPLVEEVDRRAFWELPAGALDDLRSAPQLSAEAQMWDLAVTQTLPTVLQDYVDTTSRLFFLVAGENAKTVTEVGFWRFVEYSGVLVGTAQVPMDWIAAQYDHVVTPQLDAALRAVARSQSEMSVQKLRQVAYQEMDIRSATPLQFVELLVRMAVASEKGEYGLVEGTRRLLQGLQLLNREKTSPVARELYTPESQHVQRFFNEDLFRVYLFYVKQQESSRNTQEAAMATQYGGRFAAHMSVPTVLTMLEDCRFLMDKSGRTSAAGGAAADGTRPRFFISATQVRKIAATLERISGGLVSGGLSFNLFVEMLAVLAHHWCPDPLVAEPRRLAGFLAHTMQQLSARHINSTLLLGTAPSISLEGSKNIDFSCEARPGTGTAA
ncbi:hypothetical protein NESM_000534400 [Novymonas esmeraldas]|uniref:Calponin-homology (CH) domain-containing protein n=1 Tax=Novymonas esmeraldas TaxID=1808958 RepID=A0AAW0ESN9_9TRYP